MILRGLEHGRQNTRRSGIPPKRTNGAGAESARGQNPPSPKYRYLSKQRLNDANHPLQVPLGQVGTGR